MVSRQSLFYPLFLAAHRRRTRRRRTRGWRSGRLCPATAHPLQLDKGTSYVAFRGFTFEDFEGNGIVLTETDHCLIAGNIIRNGGDYNGSAVVVNRGASPHEMWDVVV